MWGAKILRKEQKNGGIDPSLQVLQMREAEGRAEVLSQIHPVLLRDGHEHGDDRRVKLAAAAALNLFAGMRHRQGSAVGPIADHGIERIGNGKDSRAEKDLVTRHS